MFLSTACLLFPVTPRVQAIVIAEHYLQPSIDPQFAECFAKEISYWSDVYHMDVFVSLAIARQESSLNPNAKGLTGDVGVFQFHPATIKNYRLDRRRLQYDLDYAVEQHFALMAEKHEICKGDHWWECYHSRTPSHRQIYRKLVERYYWPKIVATIQIIRVNRHDHRQQD